MKTEQLSRRQLWVCGFTAGLSLIPAGAGLGWQGAVLAAPVILLGGWLMGKLLPRWGGMSKHPAAKALYFLYALWGTVLLGLGLRGSALRIVDTSGGDPAHTPWLVLLLALPLLWMAWGKGSALFRAAEIFYLAMITALGVLLVWGLFKMDWSQAANFEGNLLEGAVSAVGAAAGFLFVLPYINETGLAEQSSGMGWLGLLTGAAVLTPFVTAGVLGAAVAAKGEWPFWLMHSVLGKTARIHGLSCALWLLADYVWLGLLSRAWAWGTVSPSRWAVAGTSIGVIAALWGPLDGLSGVGLSLGTAVLAVITAVWLLLFGKNSGEEG